MQFLRDKKLARRFRTCSVSEKEQLIYYILFIILTLLSGTAITAASGMAAGHVIPNSIDRIISTISVISLFLPILTCYGTNKKGDDCAFVARYSALSIPVFVQLFLICIPLMLAAEYIDYGAESFEDDYQYPATSQSGIGYLGATILIVWYYIWRMNEAFKIASSVGRFNVSVKRNSTPITKAKKPRVVHDENVSSAGILEQLKINFANGIKASLILPSQTHAFQTSWHALWVVVIFHGLISLLADHFYYDAPRVFEADGLLYEMCRTFLIFVAAYGIALIYRRTDLVLNFTISILYALLLPQVVNEIHYEIEFLSNGENQDTYTIFWYIWIYAIIAGIVCRKFGPAAIDDGLNLRALQHIIAPLMVLAVLYYPWRYLYYYDFWYEEYQEQPATPLEELSNEELFGMQFGMVREHAQDIPVSVSGETDIYGIIFGSYAYEKVFKREVMFVNHSLQNYFGMKDRTLSLLNNQETFQETPLATATNLNTALDALSEKMQEEDIILLYLTSHGSDEGELSVNLGNGITFKTVNAEAIKEALDESGIKNRLIFVSACYSGVMIDSLADENTLIMTAAAADKTSFGCSDDSVLTYFADALFKQTLPHENNLIKAFEIAKEKILDREEEEGITTHSDPQIFIGDKILEALNKYERATPTKSEE
ncbi:MAG: C13 family peptidase [Pseudomonadota bacterium]|nr:C13 family peptidase [Pseudomonadota bacterium]